MSAWAKSPPRDVPTKMNTSSDEAHEDMRLMHTFSPTLVSNPSLRENVQSSQYGIVTAIKPDSTLPPDQHRPWEEVPTFSPEINRDDPLFQKCASSDYGHSLPPKKVVKTDPTELSPWEAVPTFSPKLESSVELREKAPSSQYGKVTPVPPAPPEPEKHTFTPAMISTKIGSELKEKTDSSHYGSKLPDPQIREPPPIRREEFVPILPPSSHRANAHSSQYGKVLPLPVSPSAPRKQAFEDEESPAAAPKKEFVLDCISSQNTMDALLLGHLKNKKDISLAPLPESDLNRQMKETASSSGYGSVSPRYVPRPERPPEVPTFKYGSASTVWSAPIPSVPATKHIKNVSSSQYGVKTPETVPYEVKAKPSPTWKVATKVSSSPHTLSLPPPLPESHKLKRESAQSHGYGVVSPEKVEREEKIAPPTWRPGTKTLLVSPHHGTFGVPTPPPKSRQFDDITSRYGSDYELPGKKEYAEPGDQVSDQCTFKPSTNFSSKYTHVTSTGYHSPEYSPPKRIPVVVETPVRPSPSRSPQSRRTAPTPKSSPRPTVPPPRTTPSRTTPTRATPTRTPKGSPSPKPSTPASRGVQSLKAVRNETTVSRAVPTIKTVQQSTKNGKRSKKELKALLKSVLIENEMQEELHDDDDYFAATQLIDGLYLTQNKYDNPTSFELIVENTLKTDVTILVGLTKSKNVVFSDKTLEKATTIGHESKGLLCKIIATSADYTLRPSFRFSTSSTPAEEEVAAKSHAELSKAIKSIGGMHFNAMSADEVKTMYAAKGNKFIDLEFPPDESSLYSEESSKRDESLIVWKRPSEFLKPGYQVFFQDIEVNDIKQGRLGDCWLMSAIAALAEFPDRVKNIFKTQVANDAGVYELELFRNGERRVLMLDDLIPCTPEGGPIFSTAVGDELWVMLLEKAFAKLAGNYSCLEFGDSCEALSDLTGCPSQSFKIAEMKDLNLFFEDLLRFDTLDYLMSAGVLGEDIYSSKGLRSADPNLKGLVPGHAYTLIRVFKGMGVRLVELRNPWGKFEWSGEWSDTSPLWTPSMRAAVQPTIGIDDGRFWMSFEDFCRHFDLFNVCYTSPDTGKGKTWHSARQKGQILLKEGKVLADSHVFSLPARSQVWLTLHQRDKRHSYAPLYVDLAIALYKVDADGSAELIKVAEGFDRQVQLQLTLDPGKYRVVPVSTGVFPADNRSWNGSLKTKNGGLTPQCLAACKEVFWRFDQNADGSLGQEEVSRMFMLARGYPLGSSQYGAIVTEHESKASLRLTRRGFVDFLSENEEQLRKDLTNLGYDANLKLSSARAYVLALHSEVPLTMEPEFFLHKDIVDTVFTNWLDVFASSSSNVDPDGEISLLTLKRRDSGVSVALRNNSDTPLLATVDSSASKNLSSRNGKNLLSRVVVPPMETVVIQHLVPSERSAWSWKYKFACDTVDEEDE